MAKLTVVEGGSTSGKDVPYLARTIRTLLRLGRPGWTTKTK